MPVEQMLLAVLPRGLKAFFGHFEQKKSANGRIL